MKRLALVLAMGCFSTMAWGQVGQIWFNYGWNLVNGTPGIGTINPFTTSGNDITLSSSYRFSFRFNFDVGDHYGAEVGYAFNHMFMNLDSAVSSTGSPVSYAMHMHQGNFNALYYPFTGTDARVRPYATAGVQFDNFVPPGGTSFYGSTKFGANFGAGVKVHVRGLWGVRFDAREYITPKPSFGFFNNSGAFWATEISAGVGAGSW